MSAKLAKWVLSLSLALILLVSAVPALAISPPDSSKQPPSSGSEAGETRVKAVYRVKLITGDVVIVTEGTDGKRSFAISPADPTKLGQRFTTIEKQGDTYIFPDGIDLEKMDMELFNTDYLVDEGYYQQTNLPLLVSYLPSLPQSQVQSLEDKVKALGQETKRLKEASTISTRLAYQDIASSYGNLQSQPEVAKIWLDRKFRVQLNESVPLIGAPSWWAAGYNGTGVKIAILDTGIDSSHPALNDLDDNPATNDPKVIVNINFTDDAGFGDLFGHGTHVAGIAAGTKASPQAHSGSYAWFSGAGDNLDNTLTRAFDLRSVSSANLTFWTLYDMEPGLDYGYLKVSTDNGTTWTTLERYGGKSGATFTKLNYNLSPYTGQNVLVRFEYITDYSVVYRGWHIDDIEIAAIAFSDDAESGAGNWTASGWQRQRMVYEGVAPGAKLWNIKVLNQWGYGYWSWVINGINFASLGVDGVAGTGDEADIISMSLGGGPTDGTDPASKAVNLAVERGVVVVVAAGNSGYGGMFTISSPGVAEKVITVGASAKKDTLAGFSSRGPTIDARIKPDILAPGVDIVSSVTTNNASVIYDPSGYRNLSGTSMATPHVAGAAALLKQYYSGNATPQFVKDTLISTAKDLGYDIYKQGGGRLDLTSVLGKKVGVTPASLSLGRFTSANTTASANFTFFNSDNISRLVTLSANLTDVFGSGNYSTAVAFSTANFTIPAAGQVQVSLNINLAALPSSLYSGKVTATVDGGASRSIHAIFGFDKTNKVTVHKTDINGVPAWGHPVWVMVGSPSLGVNEFFGKTDQSGNATFYLPGGSYDLISPNWVKVANQLDIWTIAENVTLSSDMTINLDERNTRVIDFNPNKPEILPAARATTLYYQGVRWWSGWRSWWWYPQSFVARVSPISRFDASFNYGAYPKQDFSSANPSLVNTGEWYNLLYSTDNISGNMTFTADYNNLVRRNTAYGVALQGERAEWFQWSWDNISWWSSGFAYLMDAPRGRSEWLSPQPAWYGQWYNQAWPPGEWSFHPWSKSYSPGEYKWSIGRHPFTSGVDMHLHGNYEMHVWGQIFRDSANNDYHTHWAQFSGNITVTRDGNVVLNKSIGDYFDEIVPFGGTANFTVEINGQTPLALSPKGYTRLDFVANPARDSRPPQFSFHVPKINLHGIVPGGQVSVNVTASDESQINSVRLKYSLGDNATWTDAGLPTFESGSYVFNLGQLQETFVSIAVEATDQYGNRIQRKTVRAFYVGAPGVQVSLNAPALIAVASNFTATVDINQVDKFDAANYDVSFNPTVLRLDNVTAGAIGTSGNFTTIPVEFWTENVTGTFRIVQNVSGTPGITGSGTLAVLHFSVIGSLGSSSNITLSNGVLSNNLAQGIPTAWIGDFVQVAVKPGDATGDGKVNATDITKVERIIAGLDSPTPGADANQDGSINAIDITKVERLIARLD